MALQNLANVLKNSRSENTKPNPIMKSSRKTFLLSCLALGLVAGWAVGCSETTQQKVEQKTDAAIAGTAKVMNTVATDVKDVSTNVAIHVKDFSTNIWAKTKSGAKKVAAATTNAVNELK